jgi:hypothetical protein
MGWLHRPAADEIAADQGVVGRSIEPGTPPVHDSPALAELFASFDEEHSVRVLDLGPASPVNLEFYSTFASGVRIAHLLRGEELESLAEDEEDVFVSLLGRLCPADQQTFGLILAWDLLDHLGSERPSILAHHLAAVADRGAKLHVMTTTSDTMPAKPTRFEIDDAGRLLYRTVTERRIPAPNPPPALVERWLDPFRVTRSVVLRHGVREFLATLD